ncbi:MAG: hypothetical protein HW416_723 [Chloroflexi bacterium]|nr:hypothetical protein [Chloroflexota bacterium]
MMGDGHAPLGRFVAPVAAMITLLAACAPSSTPSVSTTRDRTSAEQQAAPRGTLKLAWLREPDVLSPKFMGGSGGPEYEWLFTSTLTYRDIPGSRYPMLALEIPTQANGGWVINPDGTMVTTYRLRPNAKWHDGTPITAHDYVFAYEVYTDKEVTVQKPNPEPLMERVEAQDDHTLVIRWKEPYVNANILGYEELVPLPRQVHEAKYRTNKANFTNGEEWTTSYVSSGPFRIEQWTPGASLLARAHMGHALGPPKIDAIDIRFIPDPNAQVANLLSGEVDMINSPGVRAHEAVLARDHWAATGEGYVRAWSIRSAYIEWQYRDVPNWQRALADVRFRQALLHAIDRDGLTEAINLGFAPVAHAFIGPTDALFSEVDRVIAKYPYDSNRAAGLLAELGWRRADVGGPLTNDAGQPLDMELMTTPNQAQEGTIIVDNWKSAGVNSSLFVVPQARVREGELRSNFSGAGTNGRAIGAANWVWTAEELPTVENRWNGSNRGSFFDAEADQAHD